MEPRDVYLDKEWDEKLPNGYKHLEVLIQKACSSLLLEKEGITACRLKCAMAAISILQNIQTNGRLANK